MTSSAPTTERDPEKALAALFSEFGTDPRDLVQYLGNAPVRSANTVLASWGIPALSETGEFHGLLRSTWPTPWRTPEAFVEFVDSYVETKAIEADPDLLAALAEAEQEAFERAVANDATDDEPGPPALVSPLGQGQTIPIGLDIEGVQMQLPGVDWDQYDAAVDPHAEAHAVADSVEEQDDEPDEQEDLRARLLGEDITRLRKISRGAVKGGYSLKKPALVEAILASDLSTAEIIGRAQSNLS